VLATDYKFGDRVRLTKSYDPKDYEVDAIVVGHKNGEVLIALPALAGDSEPRIWLRPTDWLRPAK
jgi:hypothetical protein